MSSTCGRFSRPGPLPIRPPFLRLVPGRGGALLELDPDGAGGAAGRLPLVQLTGVAPGAASLEALLAAGAIELA